MGNDYHHKYMYLHVLCIFFCDYRLKLFLEQFSVPACVLNSELPVNSRCHIVSQFNTGLYDIIVASEEGSLIQTNPEEEGEKKGKKVKGQK